MPSWAISISHPNTSTVSPHARLMLWLTSVNNRIIESLRGLRLPSPHVFSIFPCFANITHMSLMFVSRSINSSSSWINTLSKRTPRLPEITSTSRADANVHCSATMSSMDNSFKVAWCPANISTIPVRDSLALSRASARFRSCRRSASYSVCRNAFRPSRRFVAYVIKKCGRSIVALSTFVETTHLKLPVSLSVSRNNFSMALSRGNLESRRLCQSGPPKIPFRDLVMCSSLLCVNR